MAAPTQYNLNLVIRAFDNASKVMATVKNNGVRNLSQMQAQANRLGNRYIQSGRDFMMMGGAMSLPLILAGKAAMDFELAMTHVVAKTGASTSQMEKLNAAALKMGRESAFTSIQAANAMDFLAMAGYKANEVIAATPKVLDLAAIGRLDPARAGDIMSNVLKQFFPKAAGEELTELSGVVSDVLVSASNSANVSVENMAETFKYLGPIAQALKMPINEVAATIGVLGDAGLQGTLAGRSFATALGRMASATPEMQKTMDALDFKPFKDGNFIGVTNMFDELSHKMQKFTPELKAMVMTDLFGADAMKQGLVLLERGGDALRAYQKSLEDTNATEIMMQEINQTSWYKWQQVTANVQNLAIKIGDQLLPIFTDLANEFIPMLSRTAEWIEKNKELTKSIIKWTAIIAGSSLALGMASFVVGGFLRIAGVGIQVVRLFAGTFSLLGKSIYFFTGASILGSKTTKTLTGTITKLGSMFKPLVTWLGRFSGAFLLLGKGALSTFRLGFRWMLSGKILLGLKTMGSAFRLFSLGVASGLRAMGLAALMNPVVLIATAGVVALGLLWYKWDEVMDDINNSLSLKWIDWFLASKFSSYKEYKDLGYSMGAAIVNGLKDAFVNLIPDSPYTAALKANLLATNVGQAERSRKKALKGVNLVSQVSKATEDPFKKSRMPALARQTAMNNTPIPNMMSGYIGKRPIASENKSSGMSVVYSPKVEISGSATEGDKEVFANMLKDNAKELMTMIDGKMSRNKYLSY